MNTTDAIVLYNLLRNFKHGKLASYTFFSSPTFCCSVGAALFEKLNHDSEKTYNVVHDVYEDINKVLLDISKELGVSVNSLEELMTENDKFIEKYMLTDYTSSEEIRLERYVHVMNYLSRESGIPYNPSE